MQYHKNFIVIPLSLFCLLTLALPKMAEGETTDSFTLGRQYFTEGKFDTAYREFYEAFKDDPANLDLNFYLGQAAFESGRFEDAVMAYDRILIADPESARVKLELARTYFLLGSKELAKELFREVLATNPPEAVAKNIEQFLAAIDESERKHFFNGFFSAGISMDSNVNIAPDNKIVDIVISGINLPVTIDQNPISDTFYSTTLNINHLYNTEDWPFAWRTNATSYNALYAQETINDLNFLNLSSGPSWQTEKRLLHLYGQVTQVAVEHDSYLNSYGLGSNLNLLLTPETVLTANAMIQKKDYTQDDGTDADSFILSLEPSYTIGSNRISLFAVAEQEDAEIEINSYFRYSVGGRYDRQLPFDTAAFASIRWQETRYQETNPLYAVRRDDESYDLACGVSKILWQPKDKQQSLSGLLSYTRTEADSSITVYSYNKNVVSLSATLTF